MSGLDHSHELEKQNQTEAGALANTSSDSDSSTNSSTGSSVIESDFNEALAEAFDPNASNDHDHAPKTGNPNFHVSLADVDAVKNVDGSRFKRDRLVRQIFSNNGDFLDPGAGNNTVIASGGSDFILGTGGGFNTITTGRGKDTIVLGAETTNRIFDFDPSKDQFSLSSDLDPSNIVIAQGKNPGKGGLNQPLDSENNALVIDKTTEHILAALTFVNSSSLSEKNFVQLDPEGLEALDKVSFNTQEGSGKLTGTTGRDKLVGAAGDDFLYVGDDSVRTRTARGIEEFPFPTDSRGRTQVDADLSNGVLNISGTWRNFDGLPLFSVDGTNEKIDPKAKILNGSDPQALVDGFLKVPQDVEGNPITGSHLHFSPAGDSRGNFADATVIRFVENTPNPDAKSGTFNGQFELTPEEQAAFLAGNIYLNVHTNIDGDGDGRAGFPTGENRVNFNQKVVSIA